MKNTKEALPPLDQIRLAEAEITRRIAAARESAAITLAEAETRAKLIRREAREAGLREGRARYHEFILAAEEEARVILERAHQRAKELRDDGEGLMDIAVRHAVNIVLGLDREDRHHDP